MPPRYDEPLLPSSPKKGRGSKKDYTVEEVLAAAKALGLSLYVPTQQEETEKQVSSKKKLGVISRKEPVQEEAARPAFTKPLKCVLHATHVVSGVSYGPGEEVLAPDQHDLLRSLLQQDQACVQAHMDVAHFQPVSRCYLIKEGNGLDRHNKFRKQSISEAAFNSPEFMEQVAVTVSRQDIAGYQPNFNPEGRPF